MANAGVTWSRARGRHGEPDIFEREGLNAHVKGTPQPSGRRLERLLDLPIVGDVRGAGYFYGTRYR